MSGYGRQALLGFQLLLMLAAAFGQQMALKLVDETLLCASDKTPVCARSRGEYLLFKNECELRKTQRESPVKGRLADVALYNCLPNCDFACEEESVPICGISVTSRGRRTFRNRCEMMRSACSSKSDWLVYKLGVCPRGKQQQPQQAAHTVLVGERKARQPLPCTNVYRPVCASYAGVKSTFSNECLVNAENMRTKRNWRIVSQGICGEDSAKMNRKFKPKSKPKEQAERSKRSHSQLNELDDFELSEDAVEIFAPSTFYTQFISNSGTMEKSYSLPARVPEPETRLKSWRRLSPTTEASQALTQTTSQNVKPCVFSNEPVCGGFNGETRTFANVCALMEYSQAVGNAWTILHEGACRSCDKSCPTVFSPVCATRNGINYTIINECYLERVRCKDPNSDWKIVHMGECVQLSDELSQSLPAPSQKYAPGIPHLLYAIKPNITNNNSLVPTTPTSVITTTSTEEPTTTTTTTTTTTAKPRRKLRKFKRPSILLKDLNYRKTRKIELQLNSKMANLETQAMKLPASLKLWSAKDSSAKDQFNKKVNSNQASASTEAATTTSSTETPLDLLDLGIAELLNMDIFDETQTVTEILHIDELATQATTAKSIATEANTGSTLADSVELEVATTPSSENMFITSNAAIINSESATNLSLTNDSEETTLPTPSSSDLTTLSNETATESISTISQENLSDENQTRKRSIFDHAKNSLIMRLLGGRNLLSKSL